MHFRPLGRWGLNVTAVGLGSWITFGGTVEDDVATACIDRAWELGVRFYDTADVYSAGAAERVVGRALAKYPREEYVLATKAFWPVGPTPNERGLSRKHLTEGLDSSLRRLGQEYVDIYQCHRYDDATPLDETCRAMDDLVRRGRTLYWGVSEWSAGQIAAAVEMCERNGWSPPISNQPQYNALYRTIERSVLPTCRRHGLGSVVWSPLAQGVLTGKYRSPDEIPTGSRAAGRAGVFLQGFMQQEVLDAVRRLEPVAGRVGCTLPQLALAWCLRDPAISSVIVGASRPEQLDDTVAAADVTLESDVVDEIDRILERVAVTG